jgi:hypothetical protein
MLRGDQVDLVIEQYPVLDQLIKTQRSGAPHKRPSSRQAATTAP